MNIVERREYYRNTHQFYHDNVPPPIEDTLFYQVHITLKWYTIEDNPSWCFSTNTRKVKNGTVHGVLKGNDIKCQEAIWQTFIGKEMPHYGDGEKSLVRAQMYDYPKELFKYLSSLKDDKCVYAYQESNYKWYLLCNLVQDRRINFMTSDIYPYHLDPNHDDKEVTKLVAFFETREEIDIWTKNFVNNISKSVFRERSLANLLD